MKKLLLGFASLLALSSAANAACDGQFPASVVCASPTGGAGLMKGRALVNGDIPSSITATKIGNGDVDNTELSRINGITAYGTTLVSLADEDALEALLDTLPNVTSIGGRAIALADAGFDAIWGWDDSANTYQNLTASDVRTALSLVVGTNVQAFDADLSTYAGITPSSNVQSLLGAADYAAMRTQLGLVIGTNVQAFDADLSTYAGITPSSNVQSLLGAADYAAMRTQLGLVIGTNVQAFDADLTALAGNAYAANATAASYIDFFEDTDNGSNRVRLQGAASTADVTLTMQSTTGTIYSSGGTDVALADGGTGASLSDPNADTLMFWDDSAGATAYLTPLAPLAITGTNIDCNAATASADGCVELATTAEAEAGTDTTRAVTPEGLLAAFSGVKTISVPAGAMTSETTTGCAAGSTEQGNGIMLITKDCDGAGSLQEGVQFMFAAPKSWNEGTITVRVDWTATSGTGNVIWLISCAAVSNDDPTNASFGTEISVTDTLTAASDLDQAPESSAVTCGGTPAEGDDVWVRIQRDGDNASDTLNSVDAKIVAARVLIGINAMTDD